MASVTSATVAIPSFTGLKAATIKSSTAVRIHTAAASPKLSVKSSLKDFGVVAVAAAASIALAGNAMAMEVLLGGGDGSLAFVPNDFTVAKGEKIVFKNNAGFPHNVVFDEDEIPSGVDVTKISMDEQDLLNAAGETYEVALTEPGTYSFYCAPHQGAGMGPCVTTLQTQVWKLKTTRKFMHFVWQCIFGCLASCQRLFKDKCCSRCVADEETINHLLFECPPSRQVWALSPIPSSSSLFPRQSLYYNMDFLFWRAREMRIGEECLHPFPWIMWYIWKARNYFIFENVREPPQETLARALQEAETWNLAMRRENVHMNLHRDISTDTGISPQTIECQVDASWKANDSICGFGWTIAEGVRAHHFGLRGSRCSLSPLHAEFDSLLWAMECLISLEKTNLGFATDCADLIKMIDNPSEWPTFAAELATFKVLRESFRSFSIRFIPRESNVHADYLAKKARARGSLFTYVRQWVPNWFSLEESHLIR